MIFDENFMLSTYSNSAGRQFDAVQERLKGLEGNFKSKMNGKSRFGLIVSVVGNMLWAVVFIVLFSVALKLGQTGNAMFSFAVFAVGGLVGSMLLESVISFSCYGKIDSYRKQFSQLINRVDVGRNSIKANYDSFMEQRTQKWEMHIEPSPSVPDTATKIENIMKNMTSLKGVFFERLKTVFFFASSVLITIAGSMALFGVADQIILGMTEEPFSLRTLRIFCWIAVIVSIVIEVILAKKVWALTDCSVKNRTLFVLVLGPVFFILLILVATLVVMLVIFLVSLLIGLAVIAFTLFCLSGSLGGG